MKDNLQRKAWKNPVKGQAPKDSTMETEGDFSKFTELMKRVVKIRPPGARTP